MQIIQLPEGRCGRNKSKQECIPVGYVPPAAVAVRGVSTTPPEQEPPWSRHPPRCGPGDPPGVGLETPPADPSTSPLGVGLETCKACWDTTTPLPRDLLQGMLRYHLQCMLVYTPL